MIENIKALSEKLKYLAKYNNSYSDYSDPKIKSENLKYNLSLLISKIILELDFINRSKQSFLDCIKEYNENNLTKLTFEDFQDIQWIRIINNEIALPEVVRTFIWRVGYYKEEEGKEIEIPKDKIDITRCLQNYYKKYFENSRLTISKEKLEVIIKNFGSEDITIDYLIIIDIIEQGTDENIFYWKKNNEHTRHLRNEIAATLWLIIGGEEATETEFNYYFKLIKGTQIWIDNLQIFLSRKNCIKILDLTISFLNEENDLLQSDNEFTKIWLDSPSYSHIDIKTEIPTLKLNGNNTIDLISNIEIQKRQFQGIFDYQLLRSFCLSLLRIVAAHDVLNTKIYHNVLKILNDVSRPHLVWTLYKDIISEFPEIIPYLITNDELVPLAFKKLDEISVNNNFLSDTSNRDKIQEENFNVLNKVYLEMFDIVLDNLSSKQTEYEKSAQIIGRVLLDNANKVLKNSENHSQDIDHNFLKKRYVEILKKISNKRISNTLNFSGISLKPRIIFFITPNLIEFVNEKIQNTNISFNEFLNISSGVLDLSIEVLRFSNLSVIEDEISEEQKNKIEKSSNDLVSNIQKRLLHFYSASEIEVQTYSTIGTIKKPPIRGVNEFGFEIIDWGYLYLHFQKRNVFKEFNDSFNCNLIFNIKSDKYDKLNKEQFEKIKLYLKSLMLAYITISTNKDSLEIEGFLTKENLKELENLIKETAIKYSKDDLSKKRLNIFDDKYSMYRYNEYYKTLISLLYECVNLFDQSGNDKFIEDFFNESIDIGGMLSALNTLDNKLLQSKIADRIKKIKVDKYIKTIYDLTELENTLVEAVNSENHWELSKPILEKIKKHLKLINQNNEGTKSYIFEINLLLAYKENDSNKLKEIEVPINEHRYPKTNRKDESIKQFYIALSKIYIDKEIDDGIKILRALLSEETKNIKYAYHLYKAQILKAKEIK